METFNIENEPATEKPALTAAATAITTNSCLEIASTDISRAALTTARSELDVPFSICARVVLLITPALMPTPIPPVPPIAKEPAPKVRFDKDDARTRTDCNAPITGLMATAPAGKVVNVLIWAFL